MAASLIPIVRFDAPRDDVPRRTAARLSGSTGIPVFRSGELDEAMNELFAADGPPCCTSTAMRSEP
jgi:hypothetical protein